MLPIAGPSTSERSNTNTIYCTLREICTFKEASAFYRVRCRVVGFTLGYSRFWKVKRLHEAESQYRIAVYVEDATARTILWLFGRHAVSWSSLLLTPPTFYLLLPHHTKRR